MAMKTLKERKTWKILLALIILIGVVTGIYAGVSSMYDRKRLREEKEAYQEAKTAGYDLGYSICSKAGEVTLDGVAYDLYSRRWDSFVDGSFQKDFLIRKDASYIDEAEGSTTDLMIYGRLEGYADDPDDETEYDPGKYEIIEPYKFAKYVKRVDMWAVAGIIVLVVIAECVLIAALAVYFIVYAVKKSRVKKA
jgi:hypothetical protein